VHDDGDFVKYYSVLRPSNSHHPANAPDKRYEGHHQRHLRYVLSNYCCLILFFGKINPNENRFNQVEQYHEDVNRVEATVVVVFGNVVFSLFHLE